MLLKNNNILSIYFTAGFPSLNSTVSIANALEKSGVDLLEIGIPFSDPIADGPTIQHSSEVAIKNGMTLEKLLNDLKELRKHVTIPVLLMGYLNPILQFGIDKFLDEIKLCGVSGIIIPDLPLKMLKETVDRKLKDRELVCPMLVTPVTSEERIIEIDSLSTGFIYAVSSPSITGSISGIGEKEVQYLKRLKSIIKNNKIIVGFGISSKQDIETVFQNADGAIIGSAFVRAIEKDSSEKNIHKFINGVKP